MGKEKTRNKIPKLLDRLSGTSACVLLNAVYFKGLWNSQFNKNLTQKEFFFLEDWGESKFQ